jgi:hypothetical protein
VSNTLFILVLIFSFSFLAFGQTGSRDGENNKFYPPVNSVNSDAGIFFDNMNGDNTVAGLEARGWVVLDEDGGGTTAAFYQGVPTVFAAYEGPDTGYAASNYNGANASGVIDHWLISPEIAVNTGDTLKFWHRAPDGNPFDDSISVKYSTTAGITPGAFDQDWGRYLVSETGWAQWAGTFNHTGTIRFAIQYYIFDGGPVGTYSNYIGLDLIEVVSGGSQTARVQVIHNSADVLADEVDVYIDGTLALDNFAFRAATPFLDLPAGVTINIGIAPGNSGSVNDTLKNFPVTLAPSETYVVFANGVLDTSLYAANPDGRNTSFTLLVKDMARESGLGSDVDFFVLHGSTDAPTVDVKAREAGNVTLVDDAAYRDITGYIQVPPADYTLDLYLSDGVTLVESFIAPLSGLGGGAASVFASGFLNPGANQNGAAFGIFAALPNGTVVEFIPGVVPVELSSFTANVSGNSVTLNWSTSTETNNKGFEIQRRSGNDFVAVGFVNGNGTTTEIQNYSFTERNLNVGSYSYRLKQVDLDGSFEYSDVVEAVIAPADFSLNQNYPNPFNPSTIITFNLAVDSKVTLTVFNTLGEEVTKLVNGNLTAGTQQVEFDASGINSGVYFYQLQATGIDGTNFSSVKKMILSK